MSFKNFSIGTKLGVVFAFLLCMLIVTISFGLISTRKVNGSVEQIAKSSYLKTVYASRAAESVHDISGCIRLLVLLKDVNAIDKEKQKIEGARVSYRESMRLLQEMESSAQGKELIQRIRTALVPAAKVNDRVMALTREHRQDEAIAVLLTEGAPLMEKLQEAFDAQLKFQQ